MPPVVMLVYKEHNTQSEVWVLGAATVVGIAFFGLLGQTLRSGTQLRSALSTEQKFFNTFRQSGSSL